MVMKWKCGRQLELHLPTWGGRRDGAGRKLQCERESPPHRVRAAMREWAPKLVTLRVRDGVPDLRHRDAWAVVVRTMRDFRGRFAVAVVHYSVLRNHMHLVNEGRDRESFAQGMKALTGRLAKRLNAHFGRRGPLFASRYHVRELATPREVRNALRYVLLNARHHEHEAGRALPPDWVDPRSTAAIFDGWSTPVTTPHRSADFGASPARTWLLRVGWRRDGLLDLDDIPGVPRLARRRAA